MYCTFLDSSFAALLLTKFLFGVSATPMDRNPESSSGNLNRLGHNSQSSNEYPYQYSNINYLNPDHSSFDAVAGSRDHSGTDDHQLHGSSGPAQYGHYGFDPVQYGQYSTGPLQYGQYGTGSTPYGHHGIDSVQYGQYGTGSTQYGQYGTGSTQYGQFGTGSTPYGQHETGSTPYVQHRADHHQPFEVANADSDNDEYLNYLVDDDEYNQSSFDQGTSSQDQDWNEEHQHDLHSFHHGLAISENNPNDPNEETHMPLMDNAIFTLHELPTDLTPQQMALGQKVAQRFPLGTLIKQGRKDYQRFKLREKGFPLPPTRKTPEMFEQARINARQRKDLWQRNRRREEKTSRRMANLADGEQYQEELSGQEEEEEDTPSVSELSDDAIRFHYLTPMQVEALNESQRKALEKFYMKFPLHKNLPSENTNQRKVYKKIRRELIDMGIPLPEPKKGRPRSWNQEEKERAAQLKKDYRLAHS